MKLYLGIFYDYCYAYIYSNLFYHFFQRRGTILIEDLKMGKDLLQTKLQQLLQNAHVSSSHSVKNSILT